MTRVKQKFKKLAAWCTAGILAVSALSVTNIKSEPVYAADAEECVIDTSKTYQSIRGFGGINLPDWVGSDMSDSQRNTAFGNGDGQLGMSVLRIYVSDNSNDWAKAVPTALAAQAKGATIFATPWNPPTSMRETFTKTVRRWVDGQGFTNVELKNQRRLKKSSYADYAQHLNSFIKYMEGQGVNLYSISIQNEPDYGEEWTWMEPDDCVEFIAKYGKDVTKGTKCKLMSPETFQYNKEYYNKILANETAFANTDLFGTHFYGTTRDQMDFPALENSGKEIWMTEVYVPNSEANSNERFPEALQVSENIHNGLVVGNMNAYVWWYIRRNYSPMNENGTISKRGYCFAQYSKFIRPGAVRVDATERPKYDGNSVSYISAYKKDNTVTIVAVNNTDTGYSQHFSLKNVNNIKNVDRYRTGSNENLALTKALENDGSSFWAQLPARTVSTFVVTLGSGSEPVVTTTNENTQPVVTTTATEKTPAATTNEYGWYFQDSFENDTCGWSARGTGEAKIALSSDTKYTEYGSKSLYASNRKSSWNGASKPLDENTFKPGNTYSFSAHVNYLEPSGSNLPDTSRFYLKLQYTDSDGKAHYDTIAECTGIKRTWVQLANTNYTIPKDASDMYLYIETDEGVTHDFYIDEVIGAAAGVTIMGEGQPDIPQESIVGDLNGDGKINVFDLIIAKRVVAGKSTNKLADIDKSGKADGSDVAMLAEWLVKKITYFDVVESGPISASPSEYMDQISSKIVNALPAGADSQVNGVDYGEIKKLTYFSTTRNRTTPVNVLLPPGYDSSKKYPVLYMLHGYWENQDRFVPPNSNMQYIYGNLVAKGEAEKMIIVFPYIYTSKDQEECSAMDLQNSLNYDNFINDLKTDLMPFIEKTYSVRTDREGRAITGFSMGGRESLYIGITCSDLFGYVGAACPAPGLTPGDPSMHPGQLQESELKVDSNKGDLYMLLITAGDNDTVVYSSPENYHNILTQNGTKNIYNVIPGGEHWDITVKPHFYNFVRFIFKN